MPVASYLRWLVLTIGACVAVTLPRFNRQDWLIQDFTGAGVDTHHYVAMIQHYRGIVIEVLPRAPFTYRPAVPWLAAQLPFDAQTALNVLSVMSLVAMVVVVRSLLRSQTAAAGKAYWLPAFLVCSFPAFYYTSIGQLDAIAVFSVAFGVWLMQRGHTLALIAWMFIACLAKETILLLVPLYVAQMSVGGDRDKWWRKAGTLLALLLAYVAAWKCARYLSMDSTQYFWEPSLAQLGRNMARLRVYLTLLFTLLPPLVVLVYTWRRFGSFAVFKAGLREDYYLRVALTGIVAGAGLYAYALFGAHGDGRPLWYTYPFFAMLYAWLASGAARKGANNIASASVAPLH